MMFFYFSFRNQGHKKPECKIFHQEHQPGGIKTDRLGVFVALSFFPISGFSPSDDNDDGDGEELAVQTRCNPVFTLCSSDNHFKS